jgi:hypothetical protein
MLVFQSGRLSYDSSRCFAEMICRSLTQCGVQVQTFEMQEDIFGQGNLASYETKLKELTKQHFDGILDINSKLPNVLLDDIYFPDYFDAPFYQLIVDHPMHLHRSLQIPLKQYRVICLDRYHKEYIRKYYPHIQQVYVMPFGGISWQSFALQNDSPSTPKEETIPMRKRSCAVLFPGTYTPLDYYREQMDSVSDSQWEICTRILHKYRQGQSGSFEEFFGAEVGGDEEFFPLMMHKARLIDRYVREWYREEVIKALLRLGITVDVMGFRWEMFSCEGDSRLRIHSPVSYPEQLAVLGQSRMTLNVQPLFRDGVHDRVMNSMANGSVALTDHCEFLEQHFSDGKELVFFEKNDLENTLQNIPELLHDTDALEEIAAGAYKKYVTAHTWNQRVETLLKEIAV